MKKKVFTLAVSITKFGNSRRTNKNIKQYVNRIPCAEQDLTTKSCLQEYINAQMSQYPSPTKYIDTSKNKIQSIKQEIKIVINCIPTKEKKLQIILERVGKNLKYFDLEETLIFINELDSKQGKLLKKKLEQIENNIDFILKNRDNENHVKQIANQVLKAINQKKKSNLI